MLRTSVVALVLLGPLFAADPANLTVHEWGTFTTVAAVDGGSEQWVSLNPPSDLPCFVYHLTAQCIKCMPNTVRMETPVLYFYAPQPLMASVHVDLPRGIITEWYPQASHSSPLNPGLTYGNEGNIEWPNVQISPGAPELFPNMGDRSHYYAARETDAA